MRFFHALSIRYKLILSSIIFILPIAVLLTFSVTGMRNDIRFSELEVFGNRYQEPLQHALAAFPDLSGGLILEDSAQVANAIARIDEHLNALAPIHEDIGEDLQFTPKGLALRDREDVFYPELMNRWNAMKDSLTMDSLPQVETMVTDIGRMITHGGDTSNLILDPDLDTYYLMDVTLLAIPASHIRLNAISQFAIDTMEYGLIDKRVARTLAVFASQLEDDQTRIKGSLDTAMNEDQNFHGVYPPMQESLPPAYTSYAKANETLVALLQDMAERKYVGDKMMNAINQTSDDLLSLWETADGELNALLNIRTETHREEMIESLVSTLLAVLVAIFIVIISASSILKSLHVLVDYARRIDDGDLDAKVTGTFSSSLVPLKESIQSTVERLSTEKQNALERIEQANEARENAQKTLEEAEQKQLELAEQWKELTAIGLRVNSLAEQVASSSEMLSASSLQQSQGAEMQKEESDAVTTAMKQMASTVVEVARNASDTSEAATEGTDFARRGVQLIEGAIGSVRGVSTSADHLASVLNTLDARAEEIGRIISVINDIADQTNLLALNAAIEAARAGDAGRGFAVVADEVRKLAEKTMEATKEVESAIKQIQSGSAEAVKSMEETKTHVEQSSESSEEAGKALEGIMRNFENMTKRVSQIATAAEQQSAAAEQIHTSLEQITTIAAETFDGASEANRESNSLVKLSNELHELSSNFKDEATDSTLLRESEGEMKGILPRIGMHFISDEYGEDVHTYVSNAMGKPAFMPGKSYPDQVLHQMADLVHEKTGEKHKAFFDKFGHATFKGFQRLYRRYIQGDSLKAVLKNMNRIHKNLSADTPGAKPPHFEIEEHGDTLSMTYVSKRGYDDYFVAIIKATAQAMGERIKINTRRTPEGYTTANIEFMK